jgi:predicted alpha/beta hydrolase family esterase
MKKNANSPRRAKAPGKSRARAAQVLFVQGAGDGAHDVDARLVASLKRALGPGYSVRYPRLPGEHAPDDAAWRQRLSKHIGMMRDGLIVVGHSAGALTLVRLLALDEIDRRLGGIFLIAAPYCGPGGWDIKDCELPTDLQRRLPNDVPVFLYHGRRDATVPIAHLALYAKALPGAVVRRLPGRDHQLHNDLSDVASDIRSL